MVLSRCCSQQRQQYAAPAHFHQLSPPPLPGLPPASDQRDAHNWGGHVAHAQPQGGQVGSLQIPTPEAGAQRLCCNNGPISC